METLHRHFDGPIEIAMALLKVVTYEFAATYCQEVRRIQAGLDPGPLPQTEGHRLAQKLIEAVGYAEAAGVCQEARRRMVAAKEGP